MKCLVIIPAYNEEENIVRVVENLKNNYPMYDYIVINDGSADGTASEAASLREDRCFIAPAPRRDRSGGQRGSAADGAPIPAG